MNATQWGRKETIVRPPHAPVYSFAAVLAAVAVTCILIGLYVGFFMAPLQRWYLPLYVRTGVIAAFRKVDRYQILSVADAHLHARPAVEADVEPGSTPQPNHRPLPLMLSDSAHGSGLVYLYIGPKISYRNGPLHAYLQEFVYDHQGVVGIFRWPLLGGLVAFFGLLVVAGRKDVERFKEMKYGRLLKGPVLVSPKGFTRALKGDGVGFQTLESKRLMRIPQQAEGQHIELMGDTGVGKSRLIFQLLLQIRDRGHSAIVYDPACEFVQRFYDNSRGDIILNPLDARCPYWGPSEELRRRAEAKAIPEDVRNVFEQDPAAGVAAIRQRTEQRASEFPKIPTSVPKASTYQARRADLPRQIAVAKSSVYQRAHSYHTKVPPDAILPFIEAFTRPGDTVYDPFCGSGMTGVAALLAGRNALLSDVSIAAVHIAKNYTTPCDPEKFKDAFALVEKDVALEPPMQEEAEDGNAAQSTEDAQLAEAA